MNQDINILNRIIFKGVFASTDEFHNYIPVMPIVDDLNSGAIR